MFENGNGNGGTVAAPRRERRQAGNEASAPAPAAAPRRRTEWFTEARFGLFIHWGLYAIPSRGEWVRLLERYKDEDYRRYFDEFNPTAYDPREWARLAKAAGQKYVVMTAKHHDGFCLFDSKLTSFKSTLCPARRDLIREYVDAFRAEGLKIGFYYSLIDWDHPGYPVDHMHPRQDDPAAKAETRDFEAYLDYFHGQVRELLTNYGKIDIIWFDFSYGTMSGETWRATKLIESIRRLHPDILVDNRLTCGHEDPGRQETGFGDFTSPEQIVPAQGVVDAKGRPMTWEACITMNETWGYKRDDRNYKSPAQLVRMLVECVSKGGNLLLNIGPDAKGRIPEPSVERLEAVGKWMRDNGASIHGCGRASLPKPDWGCYTQRGNTLYAHIFEKPVCAIPLIGLGGRVKRARLLADGSEVDMKRPWNAGPNERDAFINFPGTALPDAIDTVVEIELADGDGALSAGA
ncbi:MAG TPA: alpha-L-fucosidase [Candidatus Methylacidiphilales bacterium]